MVLVFVVDRLALWLAGMGFDGVALHPPSPTYAQWQLLDPRLLEGHLLASLWDLHSQPPLYNLGVALLLHLPPGAQDPVAAVFGTVLGLVVVLAAYGCLVELGVAVPVATAVVLVLLVADPAAAMYERWLFYAEPTAAALSCTALGAVRVVRTRRVGDALLFFGAGATAVLLNSTYQWLWWLVVCVPVVVACRSQWRTMLRAAAVPLAVVAFWVAKDAVLFGSPATSSWVGMNLANSTVGAQPRPVIAALVRRGVLSPLAEVPPFSAVADYSPRFFHAPPPGHDALDERVESNGESNLDNAVYLAVSRAYLTQDLRFITADPGRYLQVVGRAMDLWTVPADDYPFVAGLRAPVAGWARVYDLVVLWQPVATPRAGLAAEFGHRAPSPLAVSWLTVLETALAVAGTPVLIWRWRRRHPGRAAALAVLWGTSTYAFVLTSLFEVGENNRFAVELGPLPLVAATVVVSVAVGGLVRRGAAPSGDGRTRALPLPRWR